MQIFLNLNGNFSSFIVALKSIKYSPSERQSNEMLNFVVFFFNCNLIYFSGSIAIPVLFNNSKSITKSNYYSSSFKDASKTKY